MEEIKQKSWLQRNWMWAVPTGSCGCGCVGLVLLFVFGIGAALFGVSKIFDDATPVQYAAELAYKNSKVIANLGNSIKKDGISSGTLSFSNDDGEIDFLVPIKGTIGTGTIIIRGIKVSGNWIYEDVYVLITETQEHVNLLEKAIEVF
jgi:hypothetical protein